MSVVRWAFRVNSWHPTEQEWLKAASYIQAEEKERIGKFVFKRDAKSSMIGRLLIRKFLHEATLARYCDIKLSRDERGKPFLTSPNDSGIQFNVSHQGDFAVLAGVSGLQQTESAHIGVDVMKIEYSGGKTQDEFFRIMGRNFSTKEWRTIRGAGDNSDQLESFCRHWSLKESYVKATGTGITINLQDISFMPLSSLSVEQPVSDTLLYLRNELLPQWRFQESLLDSQHCVSIGTNFVLPDVNKFSLLSFQDLTLSCQPILPEDPEYCKQFFNKEEKP